jgi:uncharacterized membrane protein
MAHIEKSVTVDAPVESVFEFATDVARFPEWWKSLKEVKNFDKLHASVGSKYDWTYTMLGLTYHGTDEFLEVVPNKLYRSRSCAGQIDHAFEHRFAAEDGKTRYTVTIDYTPPGGSLFGGLADLLLLKRMNEKDAEQVVANLKAICEREVPAAAQKAAKPKGRRTARARN